MTFILPTVNNGDSPSPSSNNEVFTSATTAIAAKAYGKRWKKTNTFIVCGVLLLVAVIVALVISRNSDDGKMMVGGQGTSTANHIIGGTEVREDRYPYMVSLQTILGGHWCGGSLIARDVVLTAAHCPGVDHVTVGMHNISNYADGEDITIREELPHPSYDDCTLDNDFKLVFLDRAAENVVPVKLNSDFSFPTVGQYATSMGWGDIDIHYDNYTGSNVLKQVALKIVSNEDCENSETLIVDGTTYNYMDRISKNMMCAKGGDREDTCQGDSGGPLIVGSNDEAVQVGVVSWGWFCATDQLPGVFARVSEAYEWIQREVCGGSDYASEAGFDCDGITVSVPNPTTSPSLPECSDTPNWFDSGGDGCDWYEEMEERCGIIGLEGDMGSALDNCCVCFNYDWPARTIAPTQVDSNQPTSFLPTPTPTFFTAMPTYSVYDYGLCYTEMECEDIFNKYDIFTEFVSGDYPFHGCFSSSTIPKILYWGMGGTNEEIVSDYNEVIIYDGEDKWVSELCV